MSLHKQLWLAITALMLLALLGSFAVSSLSAKAYLEQQLSIKNNDNANALALALSAGHEDETLLELAIAAQFDTGFYRRIVLLSPNGTVLVERNDNSKITEAPAWVQRLIAIEAEPGIAQIQRGWQQAGTIELESQVRYAYAELWTGAQRLALYLLATVAIACVIGSALLHIIIRPLNAVIMQATALSERRFITTPEPSTPELRSVVRSMNVLSVRIRDMLQQEATRLAAWQRQVHYDELTGLMGRGFFLKHMDTALRGDADNRQGVLVMLRLANLGKLNESFGYEVANTLLRRCGSELSRLAASGGEAWSAGRLNGTDLALLAPEAGQPLSLGKEVHAVIRATAEELELSEALAVPCSAISYKEGESRSDVLARADASMTLAATDGGWSLRGSLMAAPNYNITGHSTLDSWRRRIEQGFTGNEFRLQTFPCVRRDGSLIHREGLVRLQADQQLLTAGAFLPWVNRLERTMELDLRVLDLAFDYLASQGSMIAINLSGQTFADEAAMRQIVQRVCERSDDLPSGLSIEVSEGTAFRNLASLRKLSIALRKVGCRLGIDRVGQQLAQLGKLHDIGIDYVKVDGALIGGVDDNSINSALLRTLCTMLHAVGIEAIADGISTDAEYASTKDLGLDGFAGPEITRRFPT